MSNTKRGNELTDVRRTRTTQGAFALVLACGLATALVIALGGSEPASAASRGFKLENKSGNALKLFAVQPVPTVKCVAPIRCVETNHDMAFEGRPSDGSVLDPGKIDVFDLKYGFSLFGGVQYAANLWYKIQGDNDPDNNVYFTIETYSTTNESACRINNTSKFTCTAEGTQLTFKRR